MSKFETISNVTEGQPGTAPNLFVASTTDSYAVITAPGYLNDIKAQVKTNDKFLINYADASLFPLNVGEASIFTELKVAYDPVLLNWNLVPLNISNSQSLIAQLGVHSAIFTNAGGSATTTFTDNRISATSIVIARWQSSANASIVQKVTPINGSLTVLSSADPGASVLEYISITPSVLLQNSGVHATTANSTGVSATVVITDPLITATSVVNANIVSSVSAVSIQKVTATAGTLTILCSAAPGISVFAYVAVTPSVALTAQGLYAAQAANAGGSATTAVTDANITATSIVVANWSSSANAVNIEKVTPSAGTLTILSSADPGASVLSYIATPVAE